MPTGTARHPTTGDGCREQSIVGMPPPRPSEPWSLRVSRGDRQVSPLAQPESVDPLGDTKLLIIDDCTLYRENLAAAFRREGLPPPAVAWDLPTVIGALEDDQPMVVLLNIATRDSAMLLRVIMEMTPHARVVVLGVADEDQSGIIACAEVGVAAFHLRSESLEDLLALVRKVARGESFVSPRVMAMLLRRVSVLGNVTPSPARELVLTAREAQILHLLEMGLSNREIATQLNIAVHTVKNHVHRVLSKLGVNSRAEAAALSRTLRYTMADKKD